MKIQDIIFFAVLAILLFRKDLRFIIYLGLICWFLSIPLFAMRVFFTAERLTWYGVLAFLIEIIYLFYKLYENRD